jgi:hypothetical protein
LRSGSAAWSRRQSSEGSFGSLLERPYSSGAGLVWGGIVGIGLFAFICARLWLASGKPGS